MAKNNYYVEFLFESKDKTNKYLFPVFIESHSIDYANDILVRTRIALSENFSVISNTYPKIVIPNFNQEYFERRYSTKVNGRCVKMDVIQWSINKYEPDLNLSFDENIELIPLENYEKGEDIATVLNQQQFPVRVIKSDNPFGFSNCLVINVLF